MVTNSDKDGLQSRSDRSPLSCCRQRGWGQGFEEFSGTGTETRLGTGSYSLTGAACVSRIRFLQWEQMVHRGELADRSTATSFMWELGVTGGSGSSRSSLLLQEDHHSIHTTGAIHMPRSFLVSPSSTSGSSKLLSLRGSMRGSL